MKTVTFKQALGVVAVAGVFGTGGYFLRMGQEHGAPSPASQSRAAEREHARLPEQRVREPQDTEFMTRSGSVDREKLTRLLRNVDASTFEELFRRIYACPLNDEDKCGFLWGLTIRVVCAGTAELAWKMFNEFKPTGELRRRLLTALFQDPTKSVASLILEQRKFAYEDEAKAALAGLTEKMRGEDFDPAELQNLPKLNERESLAISNGIAMGCTRSA